MEKKESHVWKNLGPDKEQGARSGEKKKAYFNQIYNNMNRFIITCIRMVLFAAGAEVTPIHRSKSLKKAR
jgi:hypothetical protein